MSDYLKENINLAIRYTLESIRTSVCSDCSKEESCADCMDIFNLLDVAYEKLLLAENLRIQKFQAKDMNIL